MRKTPTSQIGPRFFYGYIIVAASFIIFIAAFGVHYAFGVFLKPMLTEFGWGRAVTSGAFSISWLVQGVSAVMMGRLNDRYGPRVVLTLSGIFLSAGFFMTPGIVAGWQLYLSYGVLIGLGTSGVFVPLVSTIARWFSARRNMMTGLAVSGIGLGTFVLSPLANHLISLYDWRTSYRILGIGIFLVMVIAAQFFRRDPTQMGQLPYGYREHSRHQASGQSREYALKEALRTRAFWLVFGMFFFFGFCFSSMMVHIAPHATDIGQSAALGAALVATIGISSIAGKILLGVLGDRIGSRAIFVIGFSLMAAAMLWLTILSEGWALTLFAMAFGLSYGGNGTSQSPLVAEHFGLRSHGFIFGVVNNGFTIGATIGPFAIGSLFDHTGNYSVAFLVNAAIALAGLILSLSLRKSTYRKLVTD